MLLLFYWKRSKKWWRGFWKSCTQSTVEQKSEFGFSECVQISGLLLKNKAKSAAISVITWSLVHEKAEGFMAEYILSFPFRSLMMYLTNTLLIAAETKPKQALPGSRRQPSLPFSSVEVETDSKRHAGFSCVWGKFLNFHAGASLLIPLVFGTISLRRKALWKS